VNLPILNAGSGKAVAVFVRSSHSMDYSSTILTTLSDEPADSSCGREGESGYEGPRLCLLPTTSALCSALHSSFYPCPGLVGVFSMPSLPLRS
jgi:hypothetical protein